MLRIRFWLTVTLESTRTSHPDTFRKKHRCNFLLKNVTAKVSLIFRTLKPSRSPASAVHVSLSSIFNCQRSDHTSDHPALRLWLQPYRQSHKAALCENHQGELSGASGAPPSLVPC